MLHMLFKQLLPHLQDYIMAILTLSDVLRITEQYQFIESMVMKPFTINSYNGSMDHDFEKIEITVIKHSEIVFKGIPECIGNECRPNYGHSTPVIKSSDKSIYDWCIDKFGEFSKLIVKYDYVTKLFGNAYQTTSIVAEIVCRDIVQATVKEHYENGGVIHTTEYTLGDDCQVIEHSFYPDLEEDL